MTPQFHPHLINDPIDDPGVYIDFLFERRAILFDLGDISALPPRKLLRISDIFISHTHVDHFIGFDHLLRICLGREKRLRIFGPPFFVDQIEHRLASYTWNLVQTYPTNFTIVATELHPDNTARSAEFHALKRFERQGDRTFDVTDGILLDEQTLRIRAVFLEHRIPSLAFCLEEKNHINIMRNKVTERGWPVGPWLAELKHEILKGSGDEKPFRVWWKEHGNVCEAIVPLRELKGILLVVPGQKITYVTDVVYNSANAEKIISFAKGSDYLFIEATFLEEKADQAKEKYHLTARQAGSLARSAAAVRVIPFHFSARYAGMEALIKNEVADAFASV